MKGRRTVRHLLKKELRPPTRLFTPKLLVYLTLLQLFILKPVFSQMATIAGIVTEKNSGEVAIGVNVLLFPDTVLQSGGVPTRGASVNKFGFYSIPAVPAGFYTLVVRGIGYEPISEVISVAGDEVRKDLQIQQLNIEMGEVIVEGRQEVTETSNISSMELRTDFARHMPSLGGEVDIFRVLQLLPGVKTVSEISSGLYVRGGSPDQNLTLLDGVIVYNPYHLGGFLSTFNSDALLNTRLMKGAFPAEYGGRLSSVLDMTMREGTKEKLSGSAGINLINSRLMLEGPLGEDATFMIAGRRMYLDLLVELSNLKDTPRYYFYDLNAKMNYKMSNSDRLFASGYFGRDVLAPPRGESGFAIQWGNATGNFRWTHILSSDLFSNFCLIFTNYTFSSQTGEEDDNDFFRAISQIEDVTLRGEVQYVPDESQTVKFGVEVTRHAFDVGANSDALSRFLRINTQQITSVEGAVFVQDEWNLSSVLDANIGIRLHGFESGQYLVAEPRLSASCKLNDITTLKGSFSVAHQFMHLIIRNDISLPTDLWFPSTETVLPSRCIQYVLGLESRPFTEDYLLTFEGYYKDFKNLYEYRDRARFVFGVPLESQFTTGTGEAYGLEVFLNKQSGAVTGWVGYTLSWTKRHFPELNRGREFFPRYDRRHDIAAALMYRLSEGWEIGATWVYGTGQAYTMPAGQFAYEDLDLSTFPISRPSLDYSQRNAYRLPPFHKLDLNFIRKFMWFDLPFQFSISLYNAYNRQNPFAQTVKFKTQPILIPGTNQVVSVQSTPEVSQFTLFPLIPTLGLSVAF